MLSINRTPLPKHALLSRYAADTPAENYTDCYTTDLRDAVTHPRYVAAFYCTPLFKIERFILKWAVKRPSSDRQAQQLADGSLDEFAAWQVEDRADQQLLLTDFRGQTRSWLMVEPLQDGAGTRLYFGSAVVGANNKTHRPPGFRLLLQFHKLYSVLLLASARSRLT